MTNSTTPSATTTPDDLGPVLEQSGHAVTSFRDLGIQDYEERFGQLQAAVQNHSSISASGRREARTGMVMLQDPEIKRAASDLVQPLVEKLFAGNPDAIAAWNLYGVNHYAEGDSFKPHQDYFDGTVMIITVHGERSFDVYAKENADDVFNTVAATHRVGAGSVILLNGYHDLGHAASCMTGPSISVVADVPWPVAGHSTNPAVSLQPTELPADRPARQFESNNISTDDFDVGLLAGQPVAQRSYAREAMKQISIEFGIDPHDIRIVDVDGTIVAIDASPNGQHVGSYDALRQRRADDPTYFTVALGSERLDVLAATTDAAYRAMIADCESRAVALPDSLALSQTNGVPWSATMLTGEQLTSDNRVRVLSVNNGTVNRVDFQLHRGGTTLRVRPAIVIAQPGPTSQ